MAERRSAGFQRIAIGGTGNTPMMDLLLEAWVASSIERAKLGWMLGRGKSWRPGEKLRLLFACYCGARNTGSDLRVEEILRQVRRVLGEENVDLAVMTQNFDLTRGYFQGSRQVHLPDLFPPFLSREVPKYDGVVACEGSMFKSKFANALTTMMIGALGLASAQNRLSVGYGGEAGYMDPLVEKLCRRYCRDSVVITRSEESQAALRKLGIATELGTDTAWTFEPLASEYGQKALRDAGWDGATPVLAACPINPFWWPVKASLGKAAAKLLTGAYKKSYYRTIYFFRSGRKVEADYSKYIAAFAGAVKRFRDENEVFVVCVGMEMLDRDACERFAAQIGGAPIFCSDQYDMYQLVSILRECQLMASSRYHAIVTSMPAGVASIGITMDERIRNLMRQRGHEHLLLEVDDAELEGKLFATLQRLCRERECVRDGIGHTVARNLQLMARMGMYFEQFVTQCYPEFPLRAGQLSWEDYLPPLSPNLRQIVETYDP
ncbi:MAG TPA: polysaccharide pyruvyl transferase family protein [Candidatus Acidoferrales bacterium]|nr:polysaccharide pyruvyl transferase family protein [Candidatus Acidoferrales bacterium]